MAHSIRVLSKVVFSGIVSAAVFFGTAVPYIAQAATTPPSAEVGVILATVNIQDAKIVSQSGNTFKLSFNISNREGIQIGVKYGVQLVSETSTSQVAVDEQVYPETLTLAENSSVSREVTYIAPPNLSGTYTLVLSSKNESAFPFALVVVGKVALTPTAKGVTIDPNSCYLLVVGDKSAHHYNLVEGVDIAQNENLTLSCTAKNNGSATLSIVPSYETRYRSAYGDVVSQAGGDTNSISFAAGQSKTISLTLPKAESPQAYNVTTTLKSGDTSSNTITAHYVLSGPSATVQIAALDKSYYAKGETANLPLVWSASADAFPNSRLNAKSPSAVTASVTMTDGSGNACIATQTQILSGTKLNVPLTVDRDCSNPHVTLALIDAKGQVLAERKFNLTSPVAAQPTSSQSQSLPTSSILIALLVLVVVGGGLYTLKNKNELPPPQMP